MRLLLASNGEYLMFFAPIIAILGFFLFLIVLGSLIISERIIKILYLKRRGVKKEIRREVFRRLRARRQKFRQRKKEKNARLKSFRKLLLQKRKEKEARLKKLRKGSGPS